MSIAGVALNRSFTTKLPVLDTNVNKKIGSTFYIILQFH